MAETTLQLGFVPKERGNYASGTNYYKDNVVQYNGSSYIADPVGWSESDPTATYVTITPTDASGNLNTGWRIFASGNNTFTTGEKVDNVGIDAEPTAGSNNLVKSGGVNVGIDNINLSIKGVNDMSTYKGAIDGTRIVSYSAARYVIISVEGGSVIKITPNTTQNLSIIAIVKSFDYYHTLPYNLDFASGETSRREIYPNTPNITLPNDAKFLLVSAKTSSGDNSLPKELIINGYDYTKTLKEIILSEAQENIDSAVLVEKNRAMGVENNLGNEIEQTTKQIIECSYPNDNKILYENGQMWTLNNYKCTDLVPVKEGDTLTVSGYVYGDSTNHYACVVGYKEDGETVESVLLTYGTYRNQTLTIPSGIYYIRVCGAKSTSYPSASCIIKRDIFYTKEQVDGLLSQPKYSVILTKTSSNVFYVRVETDNGKIIYRFDKRYKKWDSLEYLDGDGNTQIATNVISANVWDNSKVSIGNGNNSRYVVQGNTNFIYLSTNNQVHVGAGHGCEVATYQMFTMDGVEVNIDSVPINTIINGNSFGFMWKSDVYASASTEGNEPATNNPKLDTSGNPITDCIHFIQGTIDTEGVHIYNKLTVVKDSITFTQLHAAMLEMQYGRNGVLQRVIVNDAKNSINNISTESPYTWTAVGDSNMLKNTTFLADTISYVGNGCFITQSIKQKDPQRWNKNRIMMYSYTDSDKRNKAYLMPFIDGETFSAGDCFEVYAERKILFDYTKFIS